RWPDTGSRAGRLVAMAELIAYDPRHRAALLAVALRAWEPILPALKSGVPAFVYTAFYPNGWRERQISDLGEVLDSEPAGIVVAVDDGRPAGWGCTRFHPADRMSEIYVLVVDPDCHRRGIGTPLMARSFARAREAGMTMMMVETGDDSGHANARSAYESTGFERWPVARYFKDLGR